MCRLILCVTFVLGIVAQANAQQKEKAQWAEECYEDLLHGGCVLEGRWLSIPASSGHREDQEGKIKIWTHSTKLRKLQQPLLIQYDKNDQPTLFIWGKEADFEVDTKDSAIVLTITSITAQSEASWYRGREGKLFIRAFPKQK